MTSKNRPHSSNAKQVPIIDKLVYGLSAGSVTTLLWTAVGFYLLFYYTDVFGLSPGVAGSIILFARLFDTFTDIFIGFSVDRFNFKWGKYRSWVLFSILPLGIFFIGIFMNIPGTSDTFKIVWSAITYGGFGAIGCTLCYVPMNAQLVNMTSNVSERASMASMYNAFNIAATLVVAAGFMPLVMMFGEEGADLSKGFFYTAVLFGGISMVLLVANFVVTKKYELNPDGTSKVSEKADLSKEKITKQLKNVISNKPAIIVILTVFILAVVNTMVIGFYMYLFTYYFNLPDFFPIALFANVGMSLLGAIALKPVVKFTRDTGRGYKLSGIMFVLSSIVLFMVLNGMSPEAAAVSMQFGFVFVIFSINGFFRGLLISFPVAIMPSAIDYGVWKTGKSQPGLIYSMYGAAFTIGAAFAGFFQGLLLENMNYVANVAQSAETLEKMIFGAIIVPAILAVFQVVAYSFAGINDKKRDEFMKEIEERDQKEEDEEKRLGQ